MAEAQSLRGLRDRRGLSINEVGRLAGVAPSTVMRLENGEVHEPLYATAVVLGRVYGVSASTVVSLVQAAYREAEAKAGREVGRKRAGRAVGAARPAMVSP